MLRPGWNQKGPQLAQDTSSSSSSSSSASGGGGGGVKGEKEKSTKPLRCSVSETLLPNSLFKKTCQFLSFWPRLHGLVEYFIF